MNPPVNPSNSVYIKDLLPGMKNFSVTFIVLEVGLPVLLKNNREVRSIKVADSTACINMSMWDEHGAAMAPGDIIKLSRAYAAVWRNALTLYSGKNGDIEKLGEFCMVFNEQLNMSTPNVNLTNDFENQPGGGRKHNSHSNGIANSTGQHRPRALSSFQGPSNGKHSAWHAHKQKREHKLEKRREQKYESSKEGHQSKTKTRTAATATVVRRGSGQQNGSPSVERGACQLGPKHEQPSQEEMKECVNGQPKYKHEGAFMRGTNVPNVSPQMKRGT